MKIASRYDEKYKFEKCPICKEIGGGKPFLELDLNGTPILVCAKEACRCLWLPKYVDVDLRALLEAQNKKVKCKVCKKEFAHGGALTGHMRGKCGKSNKDALEA